MLFICRRLSFNSKKIVYIGGVAYNATARRLSRRLSSGSSKKKFLAKSIVKKSGNKVWVANNSTTEPVGDNCTQHPGYEIRPKKGNRQWIAGNKSILVRQANAIKNKYAASKLRLSYPGKHRAKYLKVFIKNDAFVMDPSKKSLRRLSRISLG